MFLATPRSETNVQEVRFFLRNICSKICYFYGQHASPWENEDSSWIADVDLPDLETVKSETKDEIEEHNDKMSDVERENADWTPNVSIKMFKKFLEICFLQILDCC